MKFIDSTPRTIDQLCDELDYDSISFSNNLGVLVLQLHGYYNGLDKIQLYNTKLEKIDQDLTPFTQFLHNKYYIIEINMDEKYVKVEYKYNTTAGYNVEIFRMSYDNYTCEKKL